MATIDVKSETTGIVKRILKFAGDPVEEDESIIILESMKMEIPVVAPEAGTLSEFLVQAEDAVSEGAVVARIND